MLKGSIAGREETERVRTIVIKKSPVRAAAKHRLQST